MTSRPSIVLMSIDSLRYDCVPGSADRPHLTDCGAGPLPELPGLQMLADGAFAFSQCVSSAPYTTVSHASMFTGLLPTQHGVRRFFESSLSEEITPFAELLQRVGYQTALMSDRPELLRSVGLYRGIDLAAEDEREALAWWDDTADDPKLLLLHFFDVHQPYGFVRTADPIGDNQAWLEALHVRCKVAGVRIPDMPQQARHDAHSLFRHGLRLLWALGERIGVHGVMKLYLEGLARFDKHRMFPFAQALMQRGVLDDAIVIVTSDHGEGRDPTGIHPLSHAGLLVDDVIRVPLFVRLPGQLGRSIHEQVGLIDLVPTLLELIGMENDTGGAVHPLAGRSVQTLFDGGSLPDRPIYAEVWHSVRARDVPFVELSAEEVQGTQYALRQRMLRWPTRKITLIGRHTTYDASWRLMTHEDFARRLYRDILGRIEDPAGFQNMVRLLGSIRGLWRWRIFRNVHRSPELKKVPKCARFDLDRDPLEREPIALGPKTPGWHAFGAILAAFKELDTTEVSGAPLIVESDAMETVVGRLQDLGYFE